MECVSGLTGICRTLQQQHLLEDGPDDLRVFFAEPLKVGNCVFSEANDADALRVWAHARPAAILEAISASSSARVKPKNSMAWSRSVRTPLSVAKRAMTRAASRRVSRSRLRLAISSADTTSATTRPCRESGTSFPASAEATREDKPARDASVMVLVVIRKLCRFLCSLSIGRVHRDCREVNVDRKRFRPAFRVGRSGQWITTALMSRVGNALGGRVQCSSEDLGSNAVWLKPVSLPSFP